MTDFDYLTISDVPVSRFISKNKVLSLNGHTVSKSLTDKVKKFQGKHSGS